MQAYPILPYNVVFSNTIVFVVLILLTLLTLKKKSHSNSIIPPEDSQTLKGLSIVAIICIHIGYSIANDWQYLHPLSSFWGVWVDIFLLLSGFGLTKSSLKRPLTKKEFFKKRILRVAIPFWILLTMIFIADAIFLWTTYEIWTIIKSYLIFFPRADIWWDINSPFWYLTLLIFLYILYGFLFHKKYPIISAIILYIIGITWVKFNPFHMDTNWLHWLHMAAFPIGVMLASKDQEIYEFLKKYKSSKYSTSIIFLLCGIVWYYIWRIDSTEAIKNIWILNILWDWRLIIEQIKSIFLVGIIIIVVRLIPYCSKFLLLLGVISYEIYLFHWPLMARYDVFFHTLPVEMATLIWLWIFIILGFLYQKCINALFSSIKTL